MAKKKIQVKHLLGLMDKDEEIEIQFYAYGMFYASSLADGMKNVGECQKKLRYDCLEAVVGSMFVSKRTECLVVRAEIVH